MAASINASTTAGVVTTADTSGVLNIQTAGTTAISIDASQAVTFAGPISATGVVSGTNFSGPTSGFSVGVGAESYQTGLQLFGSGGGGNAYRVSTLSNNVTVTSVTTTGLGVGTTSPSTGKFSDASYAFLNQSVSTSTGSNIFASNSDNTKFLGLWSGHSGAESAIGVKSGTAFTFGAWAAINGMGGFTEWARLNSAGNFGLGVTPEPTWDSNSKALQIGSSGALWERTSDNLLALSANAYFDGAADRYIEAGFASRMYQVNGVFTWDSAPSGSADASVAWDRGMALSRTGQLSLTTTQGVAQISNIISASITNGATVDFSSFSGVIIVSNWSTGSVGFFITGGGSVVLVSSTGATYGAVTYAAGPDGYRFTNNTGSTYTFSFTAIRYRANA